MTSKARDLSKFPNEIPYDNTVSGITATDVQAAIDEVTGDLANFTGMIAAFGAATAPAGWLVANGAEVSRTTFGDLFIAIGTTWGAGNGSTTFTLPDMREAAPTGIGTRGVGEAADVYTLAQFKDDAMQGHWHGLSNVGSPITRPRSFAAASGVNADVMSANVGNNGTAAYITDLVNGTPRIGTTTHGKRVGVLYCIKF